MIEITEETAAVLLEIVTKEMVKQEGKNKELLTVMATGQATYTKVVTELNRKGREIAYLKEQIRLAEEAEQSKAK